MCSVFASPYRGIDVERRRRDKSIHRHGQRSVAFATALPVN
jgi:hypothetical protein